MKTKKSNKTSGRGLTKPMTYPLPTENYQWYWRILFIDLEKAVERATKVGDWNRKATKLYIKRWIILLLILDNMISKIVYGKITVYVFMFIMKMKYYTLKLVIK